jgi:hypothetical protein
MSLGVPPLHEKQAPHRLCGACSLEALSTIPCRVQIPDDSATFTTVAFADSSLRRFEIST